jgi:TonB family protein
LYIEKKEWQQKFHLETKGEGIMLKTGNAKKRALATLGLLLGLTGETILAQQERKVLENPTPDYPALARKMRITGTVKVTALVGTDGLVRDVQVHGGNPVLVQEVENTLKKWKYVPASYETKIELEFRF